MSVAYIRLFVIPCELKLLNPAMNTAPADVHILLMTDDLSASIQTATRLRASKIRAQVYTEQKKFKQKMSYADKLGIPFVIFLGEDEIAQEKVSLKNMHSGEQELLSLGEAAAKILKKLGEFDAIQPIC